MQTVQKALSLLNHFSERRPDFGLTEMSRVSGFDKASTRRLLVALKSQGLIEQDDVTRKYTLGSAVLRLAKIREVIRPTYSVVEPVLTELTSAIGETAHFSLFTGGQLATVCASEPAKSNRVILEEGEVLPLHASASGLAFLAFAQATIVDDVLAGDLQKYTPATVTDASLIRKTLQTIHRTGSALSQNGFEDGVCGVAAPVFIRSDCAEGAVAVAAPKSRFQRIDTVELRRTVMVAAEAISKQLGAAPATGPRQDQVSGV